MLKRTKKLTKEEKEILILKSDLEGWREECLLMKKKSLERATKLKNLLSSNEVIEDLTLGQLMIIVQECLVDLTEEQKVLFIERRENNGRN